MAAANPACWNREDRGHGKSPIWIISEKITAKKANGDIMDKQAVGGAWPDSCY